MKEVDKPGGVLTIRILLHSTNHNHRSTEKNLGGQGLNFEQLLARVFAEVPHGKRLSIQILTIPKQSFSMHAQARLLINH